MITKLGYFHFVAGSDRPIESLSEELVKLGEAASQSLIVLPELIDVGANYLTGAWSEYDPHFSRRLMELAVDHNAMLLSGMRIPVGPGAGYYNGAVIVTESGIHNLHLKNGRDGSNYVCFDGLLDANPMMVVNAIIGAVICMDIDESFCNLGDGQGDKNLFNRFDRICAENDRLKIIGVPAHMSRASGFNMISEGRLSNPGWGGYHVVMANSHADGHKSFIALPDREVISEASGTSNRLVLYHLTERRLIES